ncbi:hypothetical protein Tco_1167188, partial [Tanacetum coccineum]
MLDMSFDYSVILAGWCGSGGGSMAGWVAGGVMEAGMAMDNGAGRSALNCCIISANCLSASTLFLSIDS